MLEVKNLKKVYKVKNSDPVYALNDVSIKFPETGLVFILGKSGSGKSTLLNIIGGLDVADEGEIIIDGKSSKEFSMSEFDSYRNTYLGFIFQEYNILSDFTVKENIALALQLQHKKATDEIIKNILAEVDLSGYEKRKPNELSGGQKQRVAIARALVKEPKIIFADEPTGALDSNTGKQVFETLRNLSKEKLVVVVSHDREFAEHFGDRVIELKDGKIISDLEKKPLANVNATEGLSILGENVIRINKDHKLTSDDLTYINEAISKAEDDIYIVADKNVNKAVCQAAKIDENGERNSFTKTNEDDIKSNNDEFKTIKSKFSLWQAFRMGARSIKVKPFRLVMTVLLSTISFSLFGASLTMSLFNEQAALKSTIQRNELNTFYSYIKEQGTGIGFSSSRIEEIEKTGAKVYQNYTNMNPVPLRCGQNYNDQLHLFNWSSRMYIKDSFLDDFGFKLSYGSLPKEANECAISLYAYSSYKDLGFYTSNDYSSFIKAEDVTPETILGQKLTIDLSDEIGSKTYTITGIVDTGLPASFDDPYYQSAMGLRQSASIHSQIFIQKEDTSNDGIVVASNFGSDKSVIRYSPTLNVYYFDNNKTKLDEYETPIPLANYYYELASNEEKKEEYSKSNFVDKYKAALKEYNTDVDTYINDNYESLYKKYINSGESEESADKKKKEVRKFLFSSTEGKKTEEYISFKKTSDVKIIETLKEVNEFPAVSLSGELAVGEDYKNPNKTVTFKTVGFDMDIAIDTMSNGIKVSKDTATTLVNALRENGKYNYNYDSTGFISIKNANLDSFLSFYLKYKNVFSYNLEEDIAHGSWMVNLNNTTLLAVEQMALIVEILTHAFVYVGIVLAIFSMLLFYNFISVSINNKKREIGILRAVGAKRMDVFKIFYSEAFIIAFTNFLLSTIAVFVISGIVNKELLKNAAFDFTLMNPNFIVVLALFGISIGASIISALLPVIRIASKKPIDAIKNK